MARSWKFGALMLASTLFAGTASATLFTVPVNSTQFGMDLARTCIATSCLGAGGQVWINNTDYQTSGSVTIDTTALTMSASLLVAYSQISGAADNGITQIEFFNTTYNFSAPITIIGGNTYQLAGGATAVVDPASVTETGTGGGTTNPIYNTVVVSGSCLLGVNNSGQCGFTFGRQGFQAPAPLSRYVQHTFNLAVPEPTTLSLIGAGFLGLGWAGRKRA